MNIFKPAWWLPHAHLQTIFPNRIRKRPQLPIIRERLELPDGDFIDLDWCQTTQTTAPIVIILHGLEGSIKSLYAAGMLQALKQQQYRPVLMYCRNTSEEPNRKPYSYHAGKTDDLDFFIKTLKQREPNTPLMAIGFSLGGNMLLKWLGEQKEQAKLSAAVAVSVPYDLNQIADRIQQGFSKVYQWELLKKLRHSSCKKFTPDNCPIDYQWIANAKTFWDFDQHITAPLNGFADVNDYYAQATCRPYLKHIHVPTLLIHSKDDPFMYPNTAPTTNELSNQVTLALFNHGGHVGFVSGHFPWKPIYFLEQYIPEYLQKFK